MVSVRRKDISLTEVRTWELTLTGPIEETTAWEATLNGRTSRGEWVDMSRTDKSAGKALVLLEEAILEQKWSIK